MRHVLIRMMDDLETNCGVWIISRQNSNFAALGVVCWRPISSLNFFFFSSINLYIRLLNFFTSYKNLKIFLLLLCTMSYYLI